MRNNFNKVNENNIKLSSVDVIFQLQDQLNSKNILNQNKNSINLLKQNILSNKKVKHQSVYDNNGNFDDFENLKMGKRFLNKRKWKTLEWIWTKI